MGQTCEAVRVMKLDIVKWACQKTNAEINQRIDLLIDFVLAQGGCQEEVDQAKFEAKELSCIVLRRCQG